MPYFILRITPRTQLKLTLTELEYDHLDYTRPVSTIKPHYQKMSSPFGSKDPIREENPEDST